VSGSRCFFLNNKRISEALLDPFNRSLANLPDNAVSLRRYCWLFSYCVLISKYEYLYTAQRSNSHYMPKQSRVMNTMKLYGINKHILNCRWLSVDFVLVVYAGEYKE